jgi:hypothetical protein
VNIIALVKLFKSEVYRISPYQFFPNISLSELSELSVSLLSNQERNNVFSILDFEVRVRSQISMFRFFFNYHEIKSEKRFWFGKKEKVVDRFLTISYDYATLKSGVTSDLVEYIFQKALLKDNKV